MLAASVFHFGTFTIAQVKQALAEAGLPVRLPRRGGLTMAKSQRKKPEKSKSGGRSAERSAPGRMKAGRKQKARKAGGKKIVPVIPVTSSDAVVLDRLYTVILCRREADPTISHSARLLSRGPAKVAQKFGEEAVECLIEARRRKP